MSVGGKVRIQSYVEIETKRALDRHSKASGQSASSIVQAALTQYLDDTSDRALLFRRLDRHTRALARVQRDSDLIAEALATYVQIWFAHNPRIDESQRGAAQMETRPRYEEFCAHVSKQLAGGHRFVDDVADDDPVSPESLVAVLNES